MGVRSATIVLSVSVLLVAAIGVLDYATGEGVAVYPLYLVPVGMAAWRTGTRGGLALAVLSVAAWAGSDAAAGRALARPLEWCAAGAAQLATFVTVGLLVGRVRGLAPREREPAHTDPLTGLANGAGFRERAAAEIERMRRARGALTMAYVDLDNFKQVNDRGSLEAGDRLLRLVADVLLQSVRAGDMVARLAGDEFAVLLPGTEEEGARIALERMRKAVTLAAVSEGWTVTASIGAVSYGEPPAGVDDMVRRADSLVREVKLAGKNAIHTQTVGAAPVAAAG